jgi:hypothetical protein
LLDKVSNRLERTITGTPDARIRVADVLRFAVMPVVGWSLFLWLMWPGVMSPDSYEQWYQMLTGRYNDNHPAFHTLINRFVTLLWESPAAVAVFQILILALSVGYAIAVAGTLGCHRTILYLTSLLVAVVPTNGFIAVTLWKDVPFTAASVFLCAGMIRVLMGIGGRRQFIILGLLAAALHLIRHNGIVPAISAVLIICSFQQRHRLAILISYLAMTFLVRGPLYSLVGVVPISLPFYGAISLHFVNAHVAAKTPLPDTIKQQLEKIRNLDDWPYECTSIGPIIWDGRLKGPLSTVITPEIHKIATTLTFERPWVLVDHYRCLSSYLWRIKPYPLIGYVEGLWLDFQPDGYRTKFRYSDKGWSMSIADTPHFDGPWVREIVEGIFSADRRWYLERPAVWLYVLLFAGTVATVRTGSFIPLLFQLPLILNSLAVTFIGTQQIFRYSFPLVILAELFTLTLLFIPSEAFRNRSDKDTHQ